MNIELLLTVVLAIVLANIINKTAVNPLLNRLFGNASKAESSCCKAFQGSSKKVI